MKSKKMLILAGIAITVALQPAEAQRQRGGGNAARGGRGGGQGGNGARNVPMTPEMLNMQRRNLMIASGISDRNMQDDVLAFLDAEAKARVPLLELARKSAVSLASTTARIAALSNKTEENEQKIELAFTAYQNALAADKVRHETALKSLDASTGFMSNPRLKAFLTLVGAIDNDALALGGAPAIFNRPIPNVAGPNLPRQARNSNNETNAVAPGTPTPQGTETAATPPVVTGGFGALPPTEGTTANPA
jgi:Spy/CpxP family protein refolding chaperone